MLLRMMRGANAVGSTVAECRAMTPAVLLSIHKAREVSSRGREAPSTPGRAAAECNPQGHAARELGRLGTVAGRE